MATVCPAHAFAFNGTLCACAPGRYLANGSCVAVEAGEWAVSSGISSEPTFLTTVLPLDNIRRLTQSQAVLLEATLLALVAWLLFCLALRFASPRGGKSIWFRIRWWISRLDFFFARRHWLGDGKVVTKRKTELGGTFSVASWILFVGLLSALLYQIITKRSIEVHRIRSANAPDLVQFVNDMEFNITTISSMSCSHLRGLDTLVTGTPGFIDYRVSPLSVFVNYNCYNTSMGPAISLRCNSCQIPRRNHYISWYFVDLPNDPATAVGFQFSLKAKDHGDDKHVSFVSGTLTADIYSNDGPRTFRGSDINILKIHLFPQIYNNLHNLRLIQPLFHDFIPGSAFTEVPDLKASLQNFKDGVVNTTLSINYIFDYIVEIDKENVLGPVGFLADVGGLYAVSIGIFLYLLVQCEARIKKLRNEDSVMRGIRSRRRAQQHWDKLRKYVMYTWGPSNLDMSNASSKQQKSWMVDSFYGLGSLKKKKQPSGREAIFFNNMLNVPNQPNVVQEADLKEKVQSDLAAGTLDNVHSYLQSIRHDTMVDTKETSEKQQSNKCGMESTSQLEAAAVIPLNGQNEILESV